MSPLTQNEYTLKDSFEAARRIHSIDMSYFDQGYEYVSFDVESLFTNVPLNKTVNIILDRVYKDKLISTTLTRRTLKKLILDSCKKTVFTFNNKLYEQTDGVSMGSSLGPVLANIIMTELEKHVVSKLIKNNVIKFYARYVDDTLVLVKRNDIDDVLKKLNSFLKDELCFTVDKFPDKKVHFLDLSIDKNITDLYFKDTGQYTFFDSFAPWRFKTAWVKALFSRAHKICSNAQLFDQQVMKLRKFMSWNGFPQRVRNSVIKRLHNIVKRPRVDNRIDNTDTTPTVWIKLPYAGKVGEDLVHKLIKKLNRSFTNKVTFIIRYDTTKTSYYCSNKDPVADYQKSNVIYRLTCPGCSQTYIGKTDRCLYFRLNEHARRKDQPMFKHLVDCTLFSDMVSLMGLPTVNDEHSVMVDFDAYIHNAVHGNFEVIDTSDNWSRLEFLEAYYIKNLRPGINDGLKASRELNLF